MPRQPADLLMPGGTPLGRPGSRAEIREVSGGSSEARDLFEELTEGGVDVTPPGYPGIRRELPGGGFVGLRPVSKSGPPTIDVDIPGIDIDKIKFVP
jgi:hypothetical protein